MQLGTITQLTNNTLGFEKIFDHLERAIVSSNTKQMTDKYPPHNIIKTGEHVYVVELAIAGFSKDDIEILVEDGYLKIKGSKTEGTPNLQYIHRGIGLRSFTKTLQLADTIEVRGADLKDGILSIILENVVPENKKPKKIDIGLNNNGVIKDQLLKG